MENPGDPSALLLKEVSCLWPMTRGSFLAHARHPQMKSELTLSKARTWIVLLKHLLQALGSAVCFPFPWKCPSHSRST